MEILRLGSDGIKILDVKHKTVHINFKECELIEFTIKVDDMIARVDYIDDNYMIEYQHPYNALKTYAECPTTVKNILKEYYERQRDRR